MLAKSILERMNSARNLLKMPYVLAPACLFLYGIIRLADGTDGRYGPGLLWTVGHVLFLMSLISFLFVLVDLRKLLPATRRFKAIATVAIIIGFIGLAAFMRVAIIDIVAGLQPDYAAMKHLSRQLDDYPPILPSAFYEIGPLLFQAGLITLTILPALTRPRRLSPWSPVFIVLGMVCMIVNLNLMPVSAGLFLCAFWPAITRNFFD